MNTPINGKSTARLEARVTQESKNLWQNAADLEARSLTDFVVASLTQAAVDVIEKHKKLKLSFSDSEAFVEVLLNPPQPNQALKAAASRYK